MIVWFSAPTITVNQQFVLYYHIHIFVNAAFRCCAKFGSSSCSGAERERQEREREREEEEEEEEEEAVGGSRFLSMNIATFLKVEVAGSSETPVSAHKTTTHHVLQYHSINNDPLQRLSR